MSLPILMRAAAPRVAALAKESRVVIEGIARRVNQPGASARQLIELAKNNKLMTATILYELYGAADDLVQKFMKADPDLEAVFGAFKFNDDKPDMDAESKNEKMRDELELISAAVSQVGGFDRLMTLKRALDQDYSTYALYRSRATQGRRLSL